VPSPKPIGYRCSLQLLLFAMQNRALDPHLAAMHRVLIPEVALWPGLADLAAGSGAPAEALAALAAVDSRGRELLAARDHALQV
jgi:hypothetical protein